jgi:hypothetical protein
MNYTKYFFATIFVSCLLFCCKKKEAKTEDSTNPITTTGTTTGVIPPVEKPIPKIKTESYQVGSTTYITNYTYDTMGRVTRMSYSSGTYVIVEWSADKCVYSSFDSNNTIQSSITYNLNASGYAVNYSSGGTNVTNEFDADGYLKKTTSVNGSMGLTTSYNISNGNVTGYTSTNGGSMACEHFTDILNTIGSSNKGFSILGKQDKELQKKLNLSVGSISSEITYNYEFDSEKRVTKMVQQQGSTATAINYTYY